MPSDINSKDRHLSLIADNELKIYCITGLYLNHAILGAKSPNLRDIIC